MTSAAPALRLRAAASRRRCARAFCTSRGSWRPRSGAALRPRRRPARPAAAGRTALRRAAQARGPAPRGLMRITCHYDVLGARLLHVSGMQHASCEGLGAARALQTAWCWGCAPVHTELDVPCGRRQRAPQRGIAPRSARHWRGRTEQRRAVLGLPCRHAQLRGARSKAHPALCPRSHTRAQDRRPARRTEPKPHGRKPSAKGCRGPAGPGASKRKRSRGGGRKRGGRGLREGGSGGSSRDRCPRGVVRARARAAAAAWGHGERLAGPGGCNACAGTGKPWRVAAALWRGTNTGSWRAALA